ncbi:rho/rac/cdc gtpase-activating protein [Anaeramoeba ignava]|uniref:Rho/rac/cdc gtpase-activating protein n=1 Tax=Anaeramoeba ignava TaxID=1746090 RepID=A0A9Q0LH17_ANAIG|nr:rho/rac/cdc gtpase-activating protein [Anaeramoeba ignava]
MSKSAWNPIGLPTKEGFLTKQGGRVKNWKKRYFVLKDGYLFYFKSKNDFKPCGEISLEGINRPDADVSNGHYVYNIAALSELQKHGWITAIEKEINGKLIPLVVEKVIEFVRDPKTKALQTEGIFRLSGASSEVKQLVERFDKGEDVDLYPEKDLHAVAGLLKLFLRELPIPLLTFDLYPQFQQALAQPDQKKVNESLHNCINLLEPENRETLKALIEFLTEIPKYSQENKMGIRNVAVVFGPNLIRRENPTTMQVVEDATFQESLCKTFIENYEDIFAQTDKEKEESQKISEEKKNIQGNSDLISQLKQKQQQKQSQQKSKAIVEFVQAAHDYKSQDPNQLSLAKGEIITVILKYESGWWKGMNSKNQQGFFPSNYTQPYEPKGENYIDTQNPSEKQTITADQVLTMPQKSITPTQRRPNSPTRRQVSPQFGDIKPKILPNQLNRGRSGTPRSQKERQPIKDTNEQIVTSPKMRRQSPLLRDDPVQSQLDDKDLLSDTSVAQTEQSLNNFLTQFKSTKFDESSRAPLENMLETLVNEVIFLKKELMKERNERKKLENSINN